MQTALGANAAGGCLFFLVRHQAGPDMGFLPSLRFNCKRKRGALIHALASPRGEAEYPIRWSLFHEGILLFIDLRLAKNIGLARHSGALKNPVPAGSNRNLTIAERGALEK